MIGINRFTSSIVAARRSQTGFISIQKLVKSSVDAPGPGFEGSFPLQLSGMACTTIQAPSIPGKSSFHRYHWQRGEDAVARIQFHRDSGEQARCGAAHRPHKVRRIGVCEHLLDVPGILPVGLQRDLHLCISSLTVRRRMGTARAAMGS